MASIKDESREASWDGLSRRMKAFGWSSEEMWLVGGDKGYKVQGKNQKDMEWRLSIGPVEMLKYDGD